MFRKIVLFTLVCALAFIILNLNSAQAEGIPDFVFDENSFQTVIGDDTVSVGMTIKDINETESLTQLNYFVKALYDEKKSYSGTGRVYDKNETKNIQIGLSDFGIRPDGKTHLITFIVNYPDSLDKLVETDESNNTLVKSITFDDVIGNKKLEIKNSQARFIGWTGAELYWKTPYILSNGEASCSAFGIDEEIKPTTNVNVIGIYHSMGIDYLKPNTEYTCHISSAEVNNGIVNNNNKDEDYITFKTVGSGEPPVFNNIALTILPNNTAKAEWTTNLKSHFYNVKWRFADSDHWFTTKWNNNIINGGFHNSQTTKHERIFGEDYSLMSGSTYEYKVCNSTGDFGHGACSDAQMFIYEGEENGETDLETRELEVGVELFFKGITEGDGGITVKYSNLGPGEINGGFAIVLTNGQTTLRNEVPEGEKIASGEITSTFFGMTPGTYTVKVTLDADNDITESDEANNTSTKTITVGGDGQVDDVIKNATQTNSAIKKAPSIHARYSEDKADLLILKLERTISQLENKIVEMEKRLVQKIDKELTNRIKGRILLQVENNGEAWYVDPESENKFYMKDGQASYDIMRSLGLGITNADLETIPIGIQEKIYTLQDTDGDKIPDNLEIAIGTDPNKADTDGDGFDDKSEIFNGYRPDKEGKFNYNQSLINRLKGRIALQVESHGEAWYINPSDGRRYYLGDGNTAYNVMRFLSLGIKNDDLRKIQVGEFE
ncbi:MAG: CARDB domain-containing protein [Candidatus Falkowbacteria bacterium]